MCTEHGHYSRPLNVLNSKGETLYYELAGHPLLPCTSDCQSSLRVLRAAATHFPPLCRLVCLLYDAIRQHRLLESIDTALCAGDLEKLLKLCAISYGKLFSSIDSNEDNCGAADSGDAVDEPIRLQQPNLPDLESHLHVEHAELIAEVEKKVSDDAEFSCCSCERLLQRKQVTAFTFSETKLCSDIWIKLKTRFAE